MGIFDNGRPRIKVDPPRPRIRVNPPRPRIAVDNTIAGDAVASLSDLPINAMTGKTFDPTLPMFHGTSSAFNLGDVIAPAEVAGVPSVHNSELLPNLTSNAFATQDIDRARAYAEKAAKKSGGSPLVYRVEPVDLTNLAFDMDAPDDSSWMSSKGFRVVSPAEKEAVDKTAVDFANGSIHYAPDGRSYFLHHSPYSTIEIGEKIRTSGINQVTAGDALLGHSYGWDARTGLQNSVHNQVSASGDAFAVYLTSADTKNVFPDINVPDSPARAIKGTQDVLDRVTIPAGMSRNESEKLVSQMMTRHGIFAEESSIGRDIIDRSVLMERGHEAVDNAVESVLNQNYEGKISVLEEQLSSGGRRGIFTAGLPEGHMFYLDSRMADEYEKGGKEAALSYLFKNSPEEIIDKSQYTARVAQKVKATNTAGTVSKADQVERFLMNRGSSRLLETSMDASAAVAGGIAKSGLLRDAAAAATILGKRF